MNDALKGDTMEMNEIDLQKAKMVGEGGGVVPENQDSSPVASRTAKSDIDQDARHRIIAGAQTRLANVLALKMHTKNTHWNIKGPNFIALHELLDQIAARTDEYADLIAERIVQLGGIAQGEVFNLSQGNALQKKQATSLSESDYILSMSHALREFGDGARSLIALADELGDPVTADILTGILRLNDKDLWFVEAHLPKTQSTEPKPNHLETSHEPYRTLAHS